MKKLFTLALVSVLLFSCSKEDDLDDCSLQIWHMSGYSNGGDSEYTIEYGEDENNTTTIEVDQKTFDYYAGIFEDDDPDNCWEGLK